MKKKLPFLIVGIIAVLSLIIGLIIILVGGKEHKTSSDLSVQYIGGDKFIGQSVSNDDFKVVYLPTNSTLNSSDFLLENVVLNLEGTNVTIMYTTPEGKMVSTELTVYPTLTISSIKARLINNNKYIGSKLSQEDFEVIAIDNKGNEYSITRFDIEPSTIEAEESDIRITYKLDENVYTSDVHIKTGENYFTELKVQFVGTKNYIGQKVSAEDFIVSAVYADGQESAITDFKLVNNTLKEEVTIITISAKNSKDEYITKDIEVEGKNYITKIDSILYVGDNQTVGNIVDINDFEVYGLKSDNTKVKLDNCKIEKGDKLEKTSNTITISYFNELGNSLTGKVTVKADENIIFIGDCRTSGLDKLYGDSKDVVYFISTEKADYSWFKDVAIPAAQAIMDKNVYTKYRIVINLGLFDCDNVDKYATLFKDLGSDKWSKHKLYIISLNPVDEAQMDASKIYSRNTIDTAKIKEFNQLMSDNLVDAPTNVKYVNTNGSIINNGFTTTDGINYVDKTLKYYYSLVKSMTY